MDTTCLSTLVSKSRPLDLDFMASFLRSFTFAPWLRFLWLWLNAVKQAGDKRAYLYKLTTLGAHSFTGKTARTEDRNLEVGTETQAWRNAAYWIIPPTTYSACFLTAPSTTCSWVTHFLQLPGPTLANHPSRQLPQACHTPVLWSKFLQLWLPLPKRL